MTLADNYRVQLVAHNYVTILFEDINEFMLITMAHHSHKVTMEEGGRVRQLEQGSHGSGLMEAYDIYSTIQIFSD